MCSPRLAVTGKGAVVIAYDTVVYGQAQSGAAVDGLVVKNGSKMRFCTSGGMPILWSSTDGLNQRSSSRPMLTTTFSVDGNRAKA